MFSMEEVAFGLSDVDIRIKCLELAKTEPMCGTGTQVLHDAQKFYEWIKAGEAVDNAADQPYPSHN